MGRVKRSLVNCGDKLKVEENCLNLAVSFEAIRSFFVVFESLKLRLLSNLESIENFDVYSVYYKH